MKTQTLFEHYMTLDKTLVTEEMMITEGKIQDLIRNAATKMRGLFGGDSNTATQVMSQVVKTKIMQAGQSGTMPPRTKNTMQHIVRTLPNAKDLNVVFNLPPDDTLERLNIVDDLNLRLVDAFGDWWKQHLITKDEFRQELENFQNAQGGQQKVAMPINSTFN